MKFNTKQKLHSGLNHRQKFRLMELAIYVGSNHRNIRPCQYATNESTPNEL